MADSRNNAGRKQRADIDPQDTWNLSTMYDSQEAWERDLKDALTAAEAFTSYQGKLGESASVLADALEENARFDRILERVYVYARMKLDEDNRNAESQARNEKSMAAVAKISALTSFVTPEILSIPEETILRFLEEEPRLKIFEYELRTLLRQKAHVLSKEEENVLAQLGEVLDAPDQIFTMLNDADLKFGEITDENGKQVVLTHGNYIKYMRSQNREVRKDAYLHTYRAYRSLIHTIAANYAANVKTDVIGARLRKYPSARAAALSSGNIPESVYDSLVEQVRKTLPALHDYIALRKDLLGVDELKMYDVYVPLTKKKEKRFSFEEAVELGCKGLSPLGEDYLRQFRQGIADRWIDKYENEGKTSGAYSFGSYDSAPFVLMNFDHTLEDVFTLVHEMGHSMNSFYTRREQPFIYGSHSIFTAEVASTVNETLLMRHLIETEQDPESQRFLLNMYLEAFRTTLFRQTMFAEFELAAHRQVEDGGALTADWLSETYDHLNDEYFGPALTHDAFIQYEWARIPHFYRSFYVYQYATGYSAANAIADRILTEGEPARKDYLRFLAQGCNDDPVELLKIAGVDMASPEPVAKAMETFRGLEKKFRALSEPLIRKED